MRFDIIRDGQHVETWYADSADGNGDPNAEDKSLSVNDRLQQLNAKLDDGDTQHEIVAVSSESKTGKPLDKSGAVMSHGLTPFEQVQAILAERAATAASVDAVAADAPLKG